MSPRKAVASIAALAAVVGAFSSASVPATASTSVSATAGIASVTAESDSSEDTRSINVPVYLSNPITLNEAVEVGDESDRNIVGYRFENDGVVGEYFPRGEDPSVFIDRFRTDFGMEPRITSLVETVTATSDRDMQADRDVPDTIQVEPSESADKLSESSRNGEMWGELAAGRELARSSGLVEDASSQSGLDELTAPDFSARAAIDLSWEPTFARFGLRNLGSNPQKANIFQEFTWSEPGYDPALRDLNTALEFEINQHNASPLLPYLRPNCIWNVREHFWATNSGYSWGAFSPYGWDPVGIGAYADTNDLSDPCALQSMAIGVSNPGNVNDDGYGLTQLGLWIDANRGNVATSSHISGLVQAVEKLSCNAWPWNGNVSTDCVGLNVNYNYNGYGPSSVPMLGKQRNEWAPNKCWLRSRVAEVWEPGAQPSQVYIGSCNDMFGPEN